MAKKPMQDVFERNQYDLQTAVKRSSSWFNKQVSLLAQQNITPKQIISGDTSQNTTTIQPGHLYMYAYDPKTKEDLPYYDRSSSTSATTLTIAERPDVERRATPSASLRASSIVS